MKFLVVWLVLIYSMVGFASERSYVFSCHLEIYEKGELVEFELLQSIFEEKNNQTFIAEMNYESQNKRHAFKLKSNQYNDGNEQNINFYIRIEQFDSLKQLDTVHISYSGESLFYQFDRDKKNGFWGICKILDWNQSAVNLSREVKNCSSPYLIKTFPSSRAITHSEDTVLNMSGYIYNPAGLKGTFSWLVDGMIYSKGEFNTDSTELSVGIQADYLEKGMHVIELIIKSKNNSQDIYDKRSWYVRIM